MKRIFCLFLILCLLLAGCGPEPAAVPEPAPAPDPTPVLRCGAYAMTNAQFQYYFCYQYAAILDAYGDGAFDPKEPLDQQSYDDTRNWEEFLTEQALTLAEQTMQLCLAAEAADYSQPATGDLEQATEEIARAQGYLNADGQGDSQAYLTASYGEGASLAGYGEFLEDMALAYAYSQHLHNGGSYTEAEITAFYDERAGDYQESFQLFKTEARQMELRLIRFYPNDPSVEADWEEARERAQAVLAEYEKDPTEENFAALADAKGEDYNAPAGGLYTQVSPGSLSEALNTWLYPEEGGPSAGDYALLEETDACVLCYVSSLSERPYWMSVVENDMRYEAYFTAFAEIQSTYVFTQLPENVSINLPTAHSAEKELPEGVEAEG